MRIIWALLFTGIAAVAQLGGRLNCRGGFHPYFELNIFVPFASDRLREYLRLDRQRITAA